MQRQKTVFLGDRCVWGLLVLIFITLIVQSLSHFAMTTNGLSWEPKDCQGKPIHVNYPYAGGFLEPHACAPQCQDGWQRYIVYTNVFATQCEAPPGCRDLGEDRGVTCKIPGS